MPIQQSKSVHDAFSRTASNETVTVLKSKPTPLSTGKC